MKVPPLRRGFVPKAPILPDLPVVNDLPVQPHPVIYWTAKLSHTGITGYKVFEHYGRKVHKNSLANLLSFQKEMDTEYEVKASQERTRKLNEKQARKVKSACQKLSFYSATREFKSKKTGKYKFRVAFLTLTCPDGTDHNQACIAFDHFLHYLSRTANCVFVWKKELGELNKGLHFHVLINNFIPYYIVSWKWKRLLINQGVQWPLNSKGSHTDSHYRIELPRSRRQVSHYISKYMSKGFELPSECGYVSGHSPILDDCEEIKLIEGEYDAEEMNYLKSLCRVISDNYVTHICVNLMGVKEVAPKLFAIFEQQYIKFCELITLAQKFNFV
jgi:hypothetical protein